MEKVNRNKFGASLFACLFLFLSGYPQAKDDFAYNSVTVKRYDHPSLDIMYEFVYPEEDSLALHHIKEQLLVDFFGRGTATWLQTSESFEARLQAMQNYRMSQLLHHHCAPLRSLSGEIDKAYNFKTSALRLNNGKVVVFCMDEREYIGGGCHPLQYCTCTNYDLYSGKRISLLDLFQNLRHIDAIVNERLEQGGHYLIGVTENFLLLPKGIQFIYNQYEADCYAEGTVRITVPLSEFRGLLKPSAMTYFEE